MFIFFDHELNLGFGFGSDFVHSVENFVVNRHGMESDDDPNDLWLYFTDFLEKP